jgi:Tfp pilus assembly protein PilZ
MFNGKKVNLGSTKVEIFDIGPGGLRIKTDIKLPIRKDLILKFTMNINGEPLELPGIIVWKKEVDFEHNMYGIQFILHDKERKNVTSLLNRFQVKLRKSTTI